MIIGFIIHSINFTHNAPRYIYFFNNQENKWYNTPFSSKKVLDHYMSALSYVPIDFMHNTPRYIYFEW